jgi:amidase
MKSSQKMTWEDIAADKRSRLESTIPQEWRLKSIPSEDNVMDVPKKSGILTDKEIAITESSAVDLVEKLASKQLTSVDVTTAFCKRAAIAHQLVQTKAS